MPYSCPSFDEEMMFLLKGLRPSSICDIGAGAGKYGRMIRSLAKDKSFNPKITGVEMDQSYIERFGLKEVYDEILADNAINLINDVYRRFDLVIMGDCIEHLRKSAGVDLLNFLIYRTGYIAIIYPEAFCQNDWEQGHYQEAHISTWSDYDFQAWDHLHLSKGKVHLVLIKGYLENALGIADLIQLIAISDHGMPVTWARNMAARSPTPLVRNTDFYGF